MTNKVNGLQNTTQNSQIEQNEQKIKVRGGLRCSGRVSSSNSTRYICQDSVENIGHNKE
jgi:hypothetical protein